MATCGCDASDRFGVHPLLVEEAGRPCQNFRHGLCFGLLALDELSHGLTSLRLPFCGQEVVCPMAAVCHDTEVNKKDMAYNCNFQSNGRGKHWTNKHRNTHIIIDCTKYYKEVKLLSRVWLLAIPWTVADQAPPSMGFFRKEYWSGLPFPSPRDLADPGIEPGSPVLQADSLSFEPPVKPK